MVVSRAFLSWSILVALTATALLAQNNVTVTVDAAASQGPSRPIWTYFGYDEPNYTTAPNGRKLIGELAALSHTPVSIRVHNLLTTGDGKASLKWGSTNAYTEDANGKPVYDWTIVDGILDTIVNAGARPFIEIGYMPKALSTHPDPYQHHFPDTGTAGVFTGWSYPPNDYRKWGELVYQWVKHCSARYGQKAQTWSWEVWNEPDIPYWHGTPAEYDQLYDITVTSVRRALPNARVGGPASTGPGNPKAAAFLRQFLVHCASTGVPLDFITFHAKGSPKVIDGEVRMGLAHHLRDISDGFQIVRSFPKFKDLPVVLSESDPEGCAACSAPQNAYRNGTLYAVYMAESLNLARELSSSTGANLEGFLTWAFEFEDQPYFAGLRSLATNGIDQPVLNIFRMAGLMGSQQMEAQSSNALPLDRVLDGGVPTPSVNVFATRDAHSISVMLWNYSDPNRTEISTPVSFTLRNLPSAAHRPELHHYRIDQSHSNSYAAWKAMGSPQQPSPAQQATLQKAGQLQLLDQPHRVDAHSGTIQLEFAIPLQGISLLQFTW